MGKRSSRPPPFPPTNTADRLSVGRSVPSSKTPGAVDDGRKERKSFESPPPAAYLFLQRHPTAAFSKPLLLRLPTARAICTAEAGDRNGGKREDNEDCGAEEGAAAVRGAVGGRPPLPPLAAAEGYVHGVGGGNGCSLPPSLRSWMSGWREEGSAREARRRRETVPERKWKKKKKKTPS